MKITYVMFGYDQDWAAFAVSSVTAAQARGIAESMELRGYHMAPSRGESYPNAKSENVSMLDRSELAQLLQSILRTDPDQLFGWDAEVFRERTPEEIEELRHTRERERAERYRGVYTTLGLRIVAHEDGTMELTWKAGESVCEECASPRCRVAATTSLSSTLARSKGLICPTSP